MATTDAKARLPAWAEESDARAHKARSRMGTILAGGAIAVPGGMAVVSVFRPGARVNSPEGPVKGSGRHWLRWTVAARAGAWLIPHAISAVRGHMKGRGMSGRAAGGRE